MTKKQENACGADLAPNRTLLLLGRVQHEERIEDINQWEELRGKDDFLMMKIKITKLIRSAQEPKNVIPKCGKCIT